MIGWQGRAAAPAWSRLQGQNKSQPGPQPATHTSAWVFLLGSVLLQTCLSGWRRVKEGATCLPCSALH